MPHRINPFVAVLGGLSYEQAKRIQADIQTEMKRHNDVLKSFPKGPMNLTPDHVKALPEWQNAKRSVDTLFAKLRDFNTVFINVFKKELNAERKPTFGSM